MQRVVILLSLILVLSIGGGAAWAMQCVQRPVSEVFEEADAIFSGRILAVHFLPKPSTAGLCWYDGVKCGAKVATVDVGRIWKGEVEQPAYVYSEDGCYCLGTYFNEGEERLFVLKRSRRQIEPSSEVHRVDFDTAFCARNTMLDSAVRQGIVDQLNARFGDRW